MTQPLVEFAPPVEWPGIYAEGTVEYYEQEMLERIICEFNERKIAYNTYEAYRRGDQQLRFVDKVFQESARSMREVRENLCGAVVDAFVDELDIVGWGSDANNQLAEDLGLERTLGMSWNTAFTDGHSYIFVTEANGRRIPITRSPKNVVSFTDPTNPDQLSLVALLTREHGMLTLAVWDAQTVRVYTNKEVHGIDGHPTKGWVLVSEESHGFGVVPVVEQKQSAMSHDDHGRSILHDVIPLQDGLNKSLADALVLSKTYAIPFWYLLNYSQSAPSNPLLAANTMMSALNGYQVANACPPADTPSGQFKPGEQRIFAVDGGGPFGQLDPPDLSKVLDFQDKLALKIARVVGIPSYYLTQSSPDAPSGASLRVLSRRMQARIQRYHRDNGPVIKGLGELLGMTDVAVEWATSSMLDEVEKVQIADIKLNKLGYALQDAIADLDEPDESEILARAQAEDEAAQSSLDQGLFPTRLT